MTNVVTVSADPGSKAPPAPYAGTKKPDGARARRPFVLRLARYVRHLEFASSVTNRLDSLLSAALMVKRPRWVDGFVLSLRGVSAIGDTIDARIHREVNKHGASVWPCYSTLLVAAHTYYTGTYFKDMHWFKIPLAGRAVDVVMSNANGSIMYCDGDEATHAEVMSHLWTSWAPVCEIRGSGEHDLGAFAGDSLLTGHPRKLAAEIASEFISGERPAVLLLGEPGVGKSYAAEQIAAAITAHRTSDGRTSRVMRLPAFNHLSSEALLGLLRTLQPDVVLVHDIDTDASTAAILLRFTEACAAKGIALVCTANAVDKMHLASLRDGRLGRPVVVTHAEESLVRDVLGDQAGVVTSCDAWGQVKTWPLSAVDRLRRALAAGKSIEAALLTTAAPAPVSTSCAPTGDAQ